MSTTAVAEPAPAPALPPPVLPPQEWEMSARYITCTQTTTPKEPVDLDAMLQGRTHCHRDSLPEEARPFVATLKETIQALYSTTHGSEDSSLLSRDVLNFPNKSDKVVKRNRNALDLHQKGSFSRNALLRGVCSDPVFQQYFTRVDYQAISGQDTSNSVFYVPSILVRPLTSEVSTFEDGTRKKNCRQIGRAAGLPLIPAKIRIFGVGGSKRDPTQKHNTNITVALIDFPDLQYVSTRSNVFMRVQQDAVNDNDAQVQEEAVNENPPDAQDAVNDNDAQQEPFDTDAEAANPDDDADALPPKRKKAEA